MILTNFGFPLDDVNKCVIVGDGGLKAAGQKVMGCKLNSNYSYNYFSNFSDVYCSNHLLNLLGKHSLQPYVSDKELFTDSELDIIQQMCEMVSDCSKLVNALHSDVEVSTFFFKYGHFIIQLLSLLEKRPRKSVKARG